MKTALFLYNKRGRVPICEVLVTSDFMDDILFSSIPTRNGLIFNGVINSSGAFFVLGIIGIIGVKAKKKKNDEKNPCFA